MANRATTGKRRVSQNDIKMHPVSSSVLQYIAER